MSLGFGNFVKKNKLLFASKEERDQAWKDYRKGQKIFEETLTQQDQAIQVDINHLFKKYDRKGIARLQSQVEIDENKLVDLVGFDYQKGMESITRINTEFAELPSGVRAKFENDPAKYLAFLSRPAPAKDDVHEIVPGGKKKAKPADPLPAEPTPAENPPAE